MKGLCCVVAVLLLGLVAPSAALAQKPDVREAVASYDYTQNMHPMGISPFGNTPNLPGLTFTANSDLAFWGKYAFQGHYTGFRIINIASSANPREVSFTECNGNQGDIVVYDDILVRAWNSAAPAGAMLTACRCRPASRACTSSTSATTRIPC